MYFIVSLILESPYIRLPTLTAGIKNVLILLNPFYIA